MKNIEEFERELSSLLNKYSLENGSNTPDFILAKYLVKCLINFNETQTERFQWYNEGNIR